MNDMDERTTVAANLILQRADHEQQRSQFMTVKEYADTRGLHVQTVYAAIRRGLFPFAVERVGAAIRIDVSRESITERKAS